MSTKTANYAHHTQVKMKLHKVRQRSQQMRGGSSKQVIDCLSSQYQVGWPRSEPAAAQRWSSTICCPAWQPRHSSCTAVVRDRRRPSLCCRALWLDELKEVLLLLLLCQLAVTFNNSPSTQSNIWNTVTSAVINITHTTILRCRTTTQCLEMAYCYSVVRLFGCWTDTTISHK